MSAAKDAIYALPTHRSSAPSIDDMVSSPPSIAKHRSSNPDGEPHPLSLGVSRHVDDAFLPGPLIRTASTPRLLFCALQAVRVADQAPISHGQANVYGVNMASICVLCRVMAPAVAIFEPTQPLTYTYRSIP